jgi:hypothetical protein
MRESQIIEILKNCNLRATHKLSTIFLLPQDDQGKKETNHSAEYCFLNDLIREIGFLNLKQRDEEAEKLKTELELLREVISCRFASTPNTVSFTGSIDDDEVLLHAWMECMQKGGIVEKN